MNPSRGHRSVLAVDGPADVVMHGPGGLTGHVLRGSERSGALLHP
jgi:hypothetical protein